jgi:hypothetical protein
VLLAVLFTATAWGAELTAQQVAGELQKISAVKGLPITGLTKNTDGSFSGMLKSASITVFKLDDNWNIAILAPSITFGKYDKKLANTPLADMTLANMGLIVNLGELSFTPDKIACTPIRTALETVFGKDATIDLKSGVNFFATVSSGSKGMWGVLKKDLGLGEDPLIITGGLNAGFLSKFANGQAEDGNGDTKDFNLVIQLPAIAPPILPKALTFTGASLSFSAARADKTTAIGTELIATNELTIKGRTFSFESSMSFVKAGTAFTKSFASTMVKENSWNGPDGAKFNLQNIRFFAESAKETTNTVMSMGLGGKAAIVNGGPTIDVEGTFTLNNGVFDDFTLKLLSPIQFSKIPGVKELPGISEFAVKDVWLSLNGFSGTLVWTNKKLDASFMLYSPKDNRANWVILLKFPQLDFKKLAPRCPIPLVMPQTYLVIAKTGLNQSMGDLPVNLQEFLADLSESDSFRVTLLSGVNLIASLDPTKTSGKMNDALAKAGITSPVVISGGIEGLFGGGTPAFTLSVQLPQVTFPEKLQKAKFFKPQGAGGSFYIAMTAAGDVSIGVSFSLLFNVNNSDLVLMAKMGADLSVSGVGASVVGKLEGVWNEPFGLPGIVVEDLMIGFSTDVEGAVGIKSAGKAFLGDLDYSLKFGTKLEPAALGFPKEVALDFEASKVSTIGFVNYLQIAEALFKSIAKKAELKNQVLNTIPDSDKKAKASAALEKLGKAQEGLSKLLNFDKLPVPMFQDFRVRLVTPGATDPDLKVKGPGAGLKGTLLLFGQKLAIVDSYLDITGFKMYGELLVHNFGPLKMEEAKIDIAANFCEDPHFYINFKINLIGIKPSCKLSIDAEGLFFEMILDMNELFYARLTGETTDKELGKIRDFAISAQVKSDFSAWISKRLVDKLESWEPDEEFQEALDNLEQARKNVQELQKKIDEQRLAVLRTREKVTNTTAKAEDKVKEFEAKIKKKKEELKDIPKWRIFKRAKVAFEIAGLVIAKEACDIYAKAVEESLEALPIDVDPRVWGLIAGMKTAMVGLHAAEEIVEAGNDVTNELKEIAEKIAKGLAKLDFFVVNDAQMTGSLGALAGKAPFTLKVDATVFGEDVRLDLEFSWKDLKETAKKIVKELVTRTRNKFAEKKSAKTKSYSEQADNFDQLDGNKPFSKMRDLLKQEFRSTMQARAFAKKEFYLVSHLARLALADASGKAVIGSAFLPNTVWKMTMTSDGYFVLTSVNTGKTLTVEKGGSAVGTKIVTGPQPAKLDVSGKDPKNAVKEVAAYIKKLYENQWRLEASGKSFILRNRLSNKVLGIAMEDKKMLITAPLAGYQMELQDSVIDTSKPVLGIWATSRTIAPAKSVLESLGQNWELIDARAVACGALKSPNNSMYASVVNDKLTVVKQKDANASWELFPADNDPMSPYVIVRHYKTGRLLMPSTKSVGPLIVGLGNPDLMHLKNAIWRKVTVGDNFALLSVVTSQVLVCTPRGEFVVMPFPTSTSAKEHLWTLEEK